MGEVYRARDTRLERTVAIKILPSHLSNDAVGKQRFEREAKTISSLNHPHICVLYDVGHQDGTDYLVMECVEGETLAKRLEKGPLPLEQVLKYGAQIADALDKAHRSGVVHRDLKPSNIMLTPNGAKLLDFGLAKSAVSFVGAVTLTAAVPTSPVTERGNIVGTFQYMSPEQVEGRELDGRSDIFSLGAVLYEMTTGRRAFDGKSQISVASAILEKDPEPIARIQRTAPAALDHVIRTCLAKDEKERYQSAFDVKLELLWIAEAPQLTAGAIPEKQWRHRLAWMLASALAAAAISTAAIYYATRPVAESPLIASVLPPPGVFAATSGRIGPPKISPDGKRIAFIGCKTEFAAASMLGDKDCSIWLRGLGSAEAREVAETGGAYFPFWSPDARDIAFFADGKLKRVPADGGPVQIICDAPDARGGSWGSSGTILFTPIRVGPIYRVPADGGTPQAVTRAKPASGLADLVSHRWAYLLPDNEHFLYVNTPNGACSEPTELRFASIDGKQDISLMRGTCGNAVFASGNLITWRDGNLVAQKFDPHTGQLSGAPAAIVEHADLDPLFSIAEFSISTEGRLLYMAGNAATGSQLVWYDRSGKVIGTLGEVDHYKSVAISPDGSHVAVDTIGVKETKILILDARGARMLMTLNSSDGAFATWSPDGREVYFSSTAGEAPGIYVRATDGSGEEREVVKFDKTQAGPPYLAVSPDGKSLAYVVSDPTTDLDIYTVSLEGDGKPRALLHTFARESAPSFAPDGKWLAYESNRSGRNEVYITPYPAGGAQYQVSTNGGERPIWRHDGKEIYYRENLKMMAVEVNAKDSPIEFSTPKALFELASGNLYGRYYDVASDGRFLANTSPLTAKAQSFSLVVNWPAKLKQ
jgi:serine/threonine protein kinase/Tol biopolymer transport system component